MNTRPANSPVRHASPNGRAQDGPTTRVLGGAALAGVAFITVTCVLVQFLRTDLDWITTSMSLYVTGPYGTWVRASFYAPVPGIAALGVGWYLALDRRARSVVPLILFVVGAVALCILASFTADATRWPVTLHGAIHQWAAFATFLCITTAALLQSLCLRFDARSYDQFIEATAIASVCVVYFWIYALSPIPRGLGEKAVIALVLAWLWRAAWWLARGRASHRDRLARS
ncbi:MAG TPA: DUF998 domain-containing protein [Rhodanobacteraceae bacterium]|jgi:hypothetical protein|nr:DUF998 domain-containing protein [Rhodanobacteraceae bacterium]